MKAPLSVKTRLMVTVSPLVIVAIVSISYLTLTIKKELDKPS